MSARKLISIIGTGKLGAAVALQTAQRELGDLRLVDIIQGLPQGEALDLAQMVAEQGTDLDITGSNDYKDIAGSDLVVVIGGLGRKPGMTRLDLQEKNETIIRGICEKITEYAPKTLVLMVTNPLDVMTYLAWKVTGFEARRVFGQSGMLDTMRFKYFISKSLGVSTASIHAVVIGEHGDSMVPLPRFSTVNGVPITELLSKEQVDDAIDHTRKIAAEVIALKGATIFAPAHGITRMIESVIKDKKMVLCLTAHLNGEYGLKDVYVDVPVVLGAKGVERVIELKLNEAEKAAFMKSVEVVKTACSHLKTVSVN
ncbi:MAG TPA: malate dehydrogenase [Candidatus Acidoferrales bacterium]|nr:malate dehydrogenase [Candidatus Acidoferrales bacterium]